MTDQIKVLSRNEVLIEGAISLKWTRTQVEREIEKFSKYQSEHATVTHIGWREILRLMDEYEEPLPVGCDGPFPDKKGEYSASNQKPRIKHWATGEIAVVSPVEGGFHWWVVNEPATNKTWALISADCPDAERYARDIAAMIECESKEEKPSQERLKCDACGKEFDADDLQILCAKCGKMSIESALDSALHAELPTGGAVETSEKPENPFTGTHWSVVEHLAINGYDSAQAIFDLRDELNRLAGRKP